MFMTQEVRKLRDERRANKKLRVRTFSKMRSMTEQSYKRETDMHNIMRQFEETGILRHKKQTEGLYINLTEVGDYQTNLNKIRFADEMFQTLPSKLRDRFANNPAEFVEYATNVKNREEMEKLGLHTDHFPTEDKPEPKTTIEFKGDIPETFLNAIQGSQGDSKPTQGSSTDDAG
jgi:phage internal scaffolding protein